MLPSIFRENLFDDFFDDSFPVMSAFRDRDSMNPKGLMKTDVRELDNGYEIDMDLPGFKKEDVQINIHEGYLTVSANTSQDKEEKEEGKFIRRERYSGQCSRSFYVGTGLEPKDIGAKFEDGILRITLPKEAPKTLPENTAVLIE